MLSVTVSRYITASFQESKNNYFNSLNPHIIMKDVQLDIKKTFKKNKYIEKERTG